MGSEPSRAAPSRSWTPVQGLWLLRARNSFRAGLTVAQAGTQAAVKWAAPQGELAELKPQGRVGVHCLPQLP